MRGLSPPRHCGPMEWWSFAFSFLPFSAFSPPWTTHIAFLGHDVDEQGLSWPHPGHFPPPCQLFLSSSEALPQKKKFLPWFGVSPGKLPRRTWFHYKCGPKVTTLKIRWTWNANLHFALPWAGLDFRWKPTGHLSSRWAWSLWRDFLCFNILRYRAICRTGVGAFCVELGGLQERWLSWIRTLLSLMNFLFPGYSLCWNPTFCLGHLFFILSLLLISLFMVYRILVFWAVLFIFFFFSFLFLPFHLIRLSSLWDMRFARSMFAFFVMWFPFSWLLGKIALKAILMN